MAIKHLSEDQISKLVKEAPDTTIKDYIELVRELEEIAASRLPLEVVEEQGFRRKWNRIKLMKYEKAQRETNKV